jgi:hypothetical protein
MKCAILLFILPRSTQTSSSRCTLAPLPHLILEILMCRELQAQRNYALAKAAFEELNAELLRDIPLLYADRLSFFDPCFATVPRRGHFPPPG